ncbi:MAG: DUF916 domain-containing protein, partial [Acidobacteria bacterium]|nr:DUF916 domain-containing protein [Acidobacteriota bacterium]
TVGFLHRKTPMISSPRQWATSFVVAIAAFSCLFVTASASAPSTVPPSSTIPSGDEVGDPAVVQSWALSPASDNPDAGTRPNLTYSVTAGDVVKDKVTVYNFGNVPLNLNVYPVDAFNNVDGKFDVRPAADEPVDVGAWVELDQNLVTVMPGRQVTIPFTITVPADAAPGDHAGAIMASSTEFGQAEDGQAIALDRRTGTRLYMRVAGDVTEDVRLTRVSAEYQHRVLEPFVAGDATVKVRLENRGNTRVGGAVTVEVAGPFGLGTQRLVLDDVDEVLPGQKFEIEAKVPGVRALLFGSASARFEPSSSSGSATSVGEDSFFAAPIGLLVVVLAALVGVLVLRRRSASGRSLPPGEADPA